ncbi:hypothetical protein, partial [Akkermansia muciniphila]|uniref:hypothetical protein n=1 Tax=Akkermansia muciniphila TaxID=239935 RepID=UPI0019600386
RGFFQDQTMVKEKVPLCFMRYFRPIFHAVFALSSCCSRPASFAFRLWIICCSPFLSACKPIILPRLFLLFSGPFGPFCDLLLRRPSAWLFAKNALWT